MQIFSLKAIYPSDTNVKIRKKVKKKGEGRAVANIDDGRVDATAQLLVVQNARTADLNSFFQSTINLFPSKKKLTLNPKSLVLLEASSSSHQELSFVESNLLLTPIGHFRQKLASPNPESLVLTKVSSSEAPIA